MLGKHFLARECKLHNSFCVTGAAGKLVGLETGEGVRNEEGMAGGLDEGALVTSCRIL